MLEEIKYRGLYYVNESKRLKGRYVGQIYVYLSGKLNEGFLSEGMMNV